MVQKRSEMIRVAFALPEDLRWSGGINYLHNLLFALSTLPTKEIEPIIFAGDQVDDLLLQRFQGLGRIERHPFFNRTSLVWKVRRGIVCLTGKDVLVSKLFAKHGIDVASHCNLAGKRLPFKTINWIPDFQHLHLPELFPASEVAVRNLKFARMIRNSDCIVLSSQAAREDMKRLVPRASVKVHVVHFVAQVNQEIYEIDTCHELCSRYGLPEKFFYLPNQFWVHKNHQIVINALRLLKEKGIDVKVVCTGTKEDTKCKKHFANLLAHIKSCNVENNITILGLIDYKDVMALFRHCVSVINPSLFEGWSSTVEEAKSVGKNILLSDIPVHREQSPESALYFDPHDPATLADILLEKWQQSDGGPDLDLEAMARAKLPERIQQFGESYRRAFYDTVGRGDA